MAFERRSSTSASRRGFAALALACLSSAGCYSFVTPVMPPLGSGFTAVGAPVDTTFDRTNVKSRQGRSTSSCMFGLFAWGDASVDTAARKARIEVIEHIDCRMNVVLLGMWSQYEIIVTGH